MSRICLEKMNIHIECPENLLHVSGKRSFKFHKSLFLGMDKPDSCGMKHLPLYGGYEFGIMFHEGSFQFIGSVAIDCIPHQGMSQMGKMNPDLVRSARFEGYGQKRKSLFAIFDFSPEGECVSTAASSDRHLFSADGMAGDGKVDAAAFHGRNAVNQGRIFFSDGAVLKLLRQCLMGHIMLGNEHESGGIFIEPVNDAGSECLRQCRRDLRSVSRRP